MEWNGMLGCSYVCPYVIGGHPLVCHLCMHLPLRAVLMYWKLLRLSLASAAGPTGWMYCGLELSDAW